MGQDLRGNSRTRAGKGDRHLLIGQVGGHLEPPLVGHSLNGIDDQVEKDLVELVDYRHNRRHPLGLKGYLNVVLLQELLGQAQHFV